jgi:hypothetical protein
MRRFFSTTAYRSFVATTCSSSGTSCPGATRNQRPVHAALVELDSADESLTPRQAAAVLGNLLRAFDGYDRRITSVVASAARARAADVNELDEEGFDLPITRALREAATLGLR